MKSTNISFTTRKTIFLPVFWKSDFDQSWFGKRGWSEFSIQSLTVLNIPLESDMTYSIIAIGHWLSSLSRFKRTTSPTSKFCCFSFHFYLNWSWHKNSFFHLVQNSLAMCWSFLYLHLLKKNWPFKNSTWWQNYFWLYGTNVFRYQWFYSHHWLCSLFMNENSILPQTLLSKFARIQCQKICHNC